MQYSYDLARELLATALHNIIQRRVRLHKRRSALRRQLAALNGQDLTGLAQAIRNSGGC